MDLLLQNALPVSPLMQAHSRKMPGTQALHPAQWLRCEDAYGAQMALRDQLIAALIRPARIAFVTVRRWRVCRPLAGPYAAR